MKKRRQMAHLVETQIVSRNVSDKGVLEAMKSVDRTHFVPQSQEKFAYDDTPLPIGRGQTISQPYMVAYMTEALQLKPGMRVLEIGTGSGYQTAILAACKAEVYTIEFIPEFSESARNKLESLGYKNIHYRVGSGFEGWPSRAPFERIIATCAPPSVPTELIDELAEGGRMIIPTGRGVQALNLVTKDSDSYYIEELMMVRFVPMVN